MNNFLRQIFDTALHQGTLSLREKECPLFLFEFQISSATFESDAWFHSLVLIFEIHHASFPLKAVICMEFLAPGNLPDRECQLLPRKTFSFCCPVNNGEVLLQRERRLSLETTVREWRVRYDGYKLCCGIYSFHIGKHFISNRINLLV